MHLYILEGIIQSNSVSICILCIFGREVEYRSILLTGYKYICFGNLCVLGSSTGVEILAVKHRGETRVS